MTKDDVNALRQAADEIEALRRRNEVLQAQVRVMELFRLALTARPQGEAMGYVPDVVPRLTQMAEAAEKRAEGEAAEAAKAARIPAWRRCVDRLLRLPVWRGTLAGALDNLPGSGTSAGGIWGDRIADAGLAVDTHLGELVLAVPRVSPVLDAHFGMPHTWWAYYLSSAPGRIFVADKMMVVVGGIPTRCIVLRVRALLEMISMVPMEAAEADLPGDQAASGAEVLASDNSYRPPVGVDE